MKIVMQFIPISSFEPNKKYDLSIAKSNPAYLAPLAGGNRDTIYNLDGLLSFSGNKNEYDSYIQLYRNGIIETVNSALLATFSKQLLIPSVHTKNYEHLIIQYYIQYCSLIEKMKIEPPIFFYLTFIGMKGYKMESSQIGLRYHEITIDRDLLLLPEILLEDYNFNAKKQLKPLFDMVWNACGFERSLNFNETGQWIGPT